MNSLQLHLHQFFSATYQERLRVMALRRLDNLSRYGGKRCQFHPANVGQISQINAFNFFI